MARRDSTSSQASSSAAVKSFGTGTLSEGSSTARRRHTHHSSVDLNFGLKSALGLFFRILLLTATGNPLCRPLSITTIMTSFDNFRKPPQNLKDVRSWSETDIYE